MKTYNKGFSPKTGTFISCIETEYNDDGIGTRKVANVPVQSDKADGILADLHSGTRSFEFGAQNRLSPGTYEGMISAKVAVTVVE